MSGEGPEISKRRSRFYHEKLRTLRISAKRAVMLPGGYRRNLLRHGGALRQTPVRIMTKPEIGVQYSYGPVPSRRLGKSLGVNNIPAKICDYSCVYCQVGQTSGMQSDRDLFYGPEDIFQDVKDRLARARETSEQVDYITFVPDGEPTLDINLGREIGLLKQLGIPVGVITNSSLMWRNDVKETLLSADWVSVKIDSVDETAWRRINRPNYGLDLSLILDSLLEFASDFDGKLVTETMIVKDINSDEDCMNKTAAFIGKLKPETAYLSIPTRPPAEQWVGMPDEETLNMLYHILADRVPKVEYLIGYEGNAFAFTGDIEKDLLGITAVHPMREDAVESLLVRARCSWEPVDRLVAEGHLVQTMYNGHLYFMKSFMHDRRVRT
jgi:wyosine [tRNA(Phe)-imidazoG37] synthetase (radical SAM superfamily)